MPTPTISAQQLVTKYRGIRLMNGQSCIQRYSSGGGRWLPLPVDRSIRVKEYSHYFAWGTAPGRGGRQTALALLLDFTNDEDAAISLAGDFLVLVVESWPYADSKQITLETPLTEWQISGQEILNGIQSIVKDRLDRVQLARRPARRPGAYPEGKYQRRFRRVPRAVGDLSDCS